MKLSDLKSYKVVGPSATAPAASQPAPDESGATFPASASDSAALGSAKLLGNIPGSALKVGVDTAKSLDFVSPIAGIVDAITGAKKEGTLNADLLKKTITGLPEAAYKTLVPQFIQHIVDGNYEQAALSLRNDPVGQLAPLLLVGKQIADSAGAGAHFDHAVSTVAKPVTAPANYLTSKVAGAGGKLAMQVLGAATGAGASSIKEAFDASPSFTAALRGKIDPEQVVQSAQEAVQNIADNRRSAYQTKLGEIGENTKSLDISPVLNTLHTQLANFGVKVAPDGSLDFSRSSIANNGSARADIQGVYETLKEWGAQPGDRTPIGLDTLKKQLSDFYTDSGSARAFVQSVKGKVSDILHQQVPGYSDLTKGYQDASNLLDDIRSATGAGGRAKVDTVFTKLTTAMKGDKELRLEVMNEMQTKGAQPDLMAKIAGTNMQSFIPKSFVGKGIDLSAGWAVLGHFFSPSFIPVLLATSPRVVGEFVRALGLGKEKTAAILGAVNKYGGRVPTAAALSTAPANQSQAQKPARQ